MGERTAQLKMGKRAMLKLSPNNMFGLNNESKDRRKAFLAKMKEPGHKLICRPTIDHHVLGYGIRNSPNQILYHHFHPGHNALKRFYYDFHHVTVVKSRIEQAHLTGREGGPNPKTEYKKKQAELKEKIAKAYKKAETAEKGAKVRKAVYEREKIDKLQKIVEENMKRHNKTTKVHKRRKLEEKRARIRARIKRFEEKKENQDAKIKIHPVVRRKLRNLNKKESKLRKQALAEVKRKIRGIRESMKKQSRIQKTFKKPLPEKRVEKLKRKQAAAIQKKRSQQFHWKEKAIRKGCTKGLRRHEKLFYERLHAKQQRKLEKKQKKAAPAQ